jgi:hypothetical protein
MSKFQLDLSIDGLDRLSLGQIRYMLEEINYSIGHLERSQLELLEALVAEEDPEFAEAYWENVEVLTKKKEQVSKITKYLEENDMTFYRQNIASSESSQSAVIVESSPAATSHQLSNEEEEDEEDCSTEALLRTQTNQQEPNDHNQVTQGDGEGVYL